MALGSQQNLTLVQADSGPLQAIALTPGQTTILGRLNLNRYGVPEQLLTYISRQHVQLDVRDDNTVFVTALSSLQDQNHLIRIGDHILRRGLRSTLRVGDRLTLLVRAVRYLKACSIVAARVRYLKALFIVAAHVHFDSTLPPDHICISSTARRQ